MQPMYRSTQSITDEGESKLSLDYCRLSIGKPNHHCKRDKCNDDCHKESQKTDQSFQSHHLQASAIDI